MPTMLPSFAALPGSPAPGSVSAPGPLAVSAGFGAMLAGLAPAPVKPALAALPDTLAIKDRQGDAGSGKILPVDPLLAAPSDLIETDAAEPETSPDPAAAQPASFAEIPFWPMPSPVVRPLAAPAPAPLPRTGQAAEPVMSPVQQPVRQLVQQPVQPTQKLALPVSNDGTPIDAVQAELPPPESGPPLRPMQSARPVLSQEVETPTNAAPVSATARAVPSRAAPVPSIALPPAPAPISGDTSFAAAQPLPMNVSQDRPRSAADADPVPQPVTTPAPPARAEPVPAAQLFIGQIATALDDRAQRSGARLIDLAVDFAATGPSGGQRAELPGMAVAAPAAADQGRLDMDRREWMATMIDRIETIRADGRQDVRIRLSPDALGSIDIRITERSGVADVQVTAEQASARAMLAEAAPRLTELAESRGLRLNAQFDGSDRQSPGRSPYQPEQDAPSRPRPASSVSTTAEPKARPDDRIA